MNNEGNLRSAHADGRRTGGGMRYTKKGQQKLVDFLYAYGAYVSGLRANAPDPLVFEPDDFKSVVVLTRKEAKELIDLLSHAEDQRRMPYSYDACDAWERILSDRYGEIK